MYHVQARTADQLCSFATLCSEKAPITRQKAADGVTDVFTAMSDQGHATINIVGKIRYDGEWPVETVLKKEKPRRKRDEA